MSANPYIVPGENWIGHYFDGGTWREINCCRSGSIRLHTAYVETTGPESGNWRTIEPTEHSFDATFDGICSVANPAGGNLAELQALQIAKAKTLWRFTQTNRQGDVYIKECYFYIVDSVDTGSFDGIATFQLQLEGTGQITQIFTPPSPTTGTVYRYPAVGSTAPVAEGQYSVTIAGLGNKSILSVFKDGIGNNDIITSGTPVGKEVLYETSGADGVFTWAIPFGGESYFILYQNL